MLAAHVPIKIKKTAIEIAAAFTIIEIDLLFLLFIIYRYSIMLETKYARTFSALKYRPDLFF